MQRVVIRICQLQGGQLLAASTVRRGHEPRNQRPCVLRRRLDKLRSSKVDCSASEMTSGCVAFHRPCRLCVGPRRSILLWLLAALLNKLRPSMAPPAAGRKRPAGRGTLSWVISSCALWHVALSSGELDPKFLFRFPHLASLSQSAINGFPSRYPKCPRLLKVL